MHAGPLVGGGSALTLHWLQPSRSHQPFINIATRDKSAGSYVRFPGCGFMAMVHSTMFVLTVPRFYCYKNTCAGPNGPTL